MKSKNKTRMAGHTIIYGMIVLLFSGCIVEPVREDVPELITKATLRFTPMGGGVAIIAIASDPDGEGVQNITTNGVIALQQNQSYTLTLALINELADPTSPDYNITDAVKKEGDEHQFFFAWTDNLFAIPSGNGNIVNRNDPVGYGDTDDAGRPIGLTTSWTTIFAAGTGTFRVLLKHQPGVKSATSGSTDGETDLDVTFNIEVR